LVRIFGCCRFDFFIREAIQAVSVGTTFTEIVSRFPYDIALAHGYLLSVPK
jgi:hypothetical protein